MVPLRAVMQRSPSWSRSDTLLCLAYVNCVLVAFTYIIVLSSGFYNSTNIGGNINFPWEFLCTIILHHSECVYSLQNNLLWKSGRWPDLPVCVDTPEFSWPNTELAQHQEEEADCVWSVEYNQRARTLQDSQMHVQAGTQLFVCLCWSLSSSPTLSDHTVTAWTFI